MFQPWIHCYSLNGISLTVIVILPCLSLDVLQTLNSRRKNGEKEKKERNWSDFCQALFFTWHISYFLGVARWQTDYPSTGGPISRSRHDRKPLALSRSSPRAQLLVSPTWSWPLAPREPTWVIPQTNGSVFHSRLKVFGIVLRDLPAPLSAALPTGRKWVRGTESARGGGRGSDLEPPPNQGSTFISRCHYSPSRSLTDGIVGYRILWQVIFHIQFLFPFDEKFSLQSNSVCSLNIDWTLSPPHSLSPLLFSFTGVSSVSSDLLASCSWRPL